MTTALYFLNKSTVINIVKGTNAYGAASNGVLTAYLSDTEELQPLPKSTNLQSIYSVN